MTSSWVATKLCDKSAYGITVDNNGTVYFTNSDKVYQLRLEENDVIQEPQVLVNIMYNRFQGIIWNGNNILYVCSFFHNTILSYSLDTKTVSTFAGGKGGYKDGYLQYAQFCSPYGIDMDKNGDLYVTDVYGVRKINVAEGIVITIAGCGEKGHRDGEARLAMFNFVQEMALCDDGTIYVVDNDNHCIRKIKDGIVSTIAGAPGQLGYQNGLLALSKFYYPESLLMDNDGTLLVGATLQDCSL